MNQPKIKRESFPVVTISREDVNCALGLSLDHKFGMGLSNNDMVLIAKRLSDAYTELGGTQDVLRDVVYIVLRR